MEKWKNQYCEPNLGHLKNVFFFKNVGFLAQQIVNLSYCAVVYPMAVYRSIVLPYISECVDNVPLVYQ